jgi:hypothetical protein
MGSKDAKSAAAAEAGVIRSVLATLGALAQRAGTGFKPYVAEVMPLVIESIQVGSGALHKIVTRDWHVLLPAASTTATNVAVVALSQSTLAAQCMHPHAHTCELCSVCRIWAHPASAVQLL